MKHSASAAPMRDISRPALAITVNGKVLPVAVALHVSSVSVDEDVGLPGMFAIELAGGGADDETAWVDDDTFAIGAAVEIKMGYGDSPQTVIAAEITGIEPAFARCNGPSLTVRGHDGRHRLMRGRKTRSFLTHKDSVIADAIASDAGLAVKVVDSKVVHDYVLQANQTDLEFLQERAARIQYEIVVEGRTLHFRPVQNDQGQMLTLTFEDDLLEFHPRLSTMGQFDEIEVRGWNPQAKKEIVGRARRGDEGSKMGGAESGAAIAESAFGAAAVLFSGAPVFTQAEADQRALALLKRSVLDLIQGDGICSGRADLRPGRVVTIDGVGTRFSGQYYVSATSHRYTQRDAYQTHFVVCRNAS